ncbi:sigma factor-like helix-turn-helix DNA-binding protein [Kitasatospora sp. KL5]|uniref:sigma factor-like helix-turn-helix DNA-binding protein n=1 Tax=Kitasatospora sp. KL5 TaxID=3425125 RepID=UPI003D6F2779
MIPDEATADLHAFFDRHHAELARLAHLLTGGTEAADDLAADALAGLGRHWEQVLRTGSPLARARGEVVRLARAGDRAAAPRRRRTAPAAGGGDVLAALQRLPFRRRVCVVLRYAFDLPAVEAAQVLGTAVGTVERRTAKGAAELQRQLGTRAADGLLGRRNR